LRFVVISWFKIRKIEIEPMRQLAIVFLAMLLFAMHSLHGQKIGDFVFSKLPQSYQLYPRAENNSTTRASDPNSLSIKTAITCFLIISLIFLKLLLT
jgi:hypothetical protein